MSDLVTCVGCGDTLKNELVAFSDAKWELIHGKPICRECARAVAEMVIMDY